MRIVYGIVCVLMVLFVVVQNKAADGPLWMAIYGAPAILAGLAAWRPGLIHQGLGRAVLLVCLALAIAGTIYYWPSMAGFWHKDVWWAEETAREGMGMMIVTAGLVILAVPMVFRRS